MCSPLLETPPLFPRFLASIYQEQDLSGPVGPQHCLLSKACPSPWVRLPQRCFALRSCLFCPSIDGDWINVNERRKGPAQNYRHKSQQALERAACDRKWPSSPHLRTQLSLLHGRKIHTQERGPCFLLFKFSTGAIILKKAHCASRFLRSCYPWELT